MAELRKRFQIGKAYRFNQAMIYRMVSSLAQFDPNYKALDEIILDSATMEASSRVGFANVKKGGNFYTHPAFIDALSQSAGFVMNANDRSNLEEEVFVNHGWRNFQLLEALSENVKYETYVRMQKGQENRWEGDIMVLDGERIVASFEGIAVRLTPRFYIEIKVHCTLLGLTNMTISFKAYQGEFCIIYSQETADRQLSLDQSRMKDLRKSFQPQELRST